jgi:hypothetical protein
MRRIGLIYVMSSHRRSGQDWLRQMDAPFNSGRRRGALKPGESEAPRAGPRCLLEVLKVAFLGICEL